MNAILTFCYCLLVAGIHSDQVTIELITGEQQTVDLAEITADGFLRNSAAENIGELSQLLVVRYPRAMNAETPASAWIALPAGGRITAQQIELQDEKIRFVGETLSSPLPMEAIRGIVWQAHERVTAAMAAPLADQDQVVVQTDDAVVVVSGLLESFDADRLRLDYQGETRTLAREKVLAIVLANLDANQTSVTNATATVQLTNGDRVVGKLMRFVDGKFSIQLPGNYPVMLAANQIASIELITDRLLNLTTLSPVIQEQRTGFALQRPWQTDRNILGKPLSLRLLPSGPVTEFKRGLGLNSFTRLVYELPPGFDQFQATIGIDAITGERGDCQVSIMADGIRIWTARMQGGGVAETVKLQIENTRQLELIVDPGQNFDLADHINVVNPRLLKTK